MMSSSIGIFPIILIILICLIIISKFVLKICLVDRKINTKSLIISLFSIISYILNIINLPFNPRDNSKHTLANLIITSLSFLLSVLFIIITGTTIIDLCQYIVKGSKVFVASNIIACLILQFITLGLSITKFVIIKKN